jgi:IMP dehydrogenase/GMP reductase
MGSREARAVSRLGGAGIVIGGGFANTAEQRKLGRNWQREVVRPGGYLSSQASR